MTTRYRTTKATQDAVLDALRAHPDGATETMLSNDTKIKQERVKLALQEMHVTYIDRWGRIGSRGPTLSPIWMAAEVPENCPKPDGVN